jgi:hypothetical protein
VPPPRPRWNRLRLRPAWTYRRADLPRFGTTTSCRHDTLPFRSAGIRKASSGPIGEERAKHWCGTFVGMDAAAVASAIGQIASAALTVPAVFVAYFAYKASRSASVAAKALTSIERMRLHAEMRPQFEIRACDSAIPDTVFVDLTLVGPPALHDLRDVRVIVRKGGGTAPAWVLAGIGVDLDAEYDEHPLSMTLEDPVGIALRTTFRTGRQKRNSWPTIRLSLICHHDGYEPWVIPLTTNVQILPGLPMWRRMSRFNRELCKGERDSVAEMIAKHERHVAEQNVREIGEAIGGERVPGTNVNWQHRGSV